MGKEREMRLEFGDCSFDLATRELKRNDRLVALPPKSFELLEQLLLNRPRALSKAELHDRLWPDTFVSETSLPRLVSELRKATGDSSGEPIYVRTVHGYGYAFCGDAVELREADRERVKSLAVLPFDDLVDGGDNRHLSIGVADAIITELARAGSLIVRPTAAIRRIEGRGLGPQQAGAELGVDAVVDGSFQRSGARLRVTALLVDTDSGEPVWGTKIDTTLDDIFEMQDEVAAHVAEALEVELTTGDPARLQLDVRAHEWCLKGRLHMLHENLPGIRAAISAFEAAIELDPRHAPAYAGLAAAYARLAFTFEPGGSWDEKAREMCEHALRIDPELAEARLVSGRLLWSPQGEFDHAGAIEQATRSIEANRGLSEAHAFLGTVLFHLAMFEESDRALARSIEIDPHNWDAHVMRATCRYLEGRYREATVILTREVAPGVSAWARYVAALCALQLGDLSAASEAAAHERANGAVPVYFSSLEGLVHACRGEEREAMSKVNEAVENRGIFGHYHHVEYDIGCIYALLGHAEDAVDWIEKAASNGFPCHRSFAEDPLLASLRTDRRFTALLDRLREECSGYAELLSA